MDLLERSRFMLFCHCDNAITELRQDVKESLNRFLNRFFETFESMIQGNKSDPSLD